MDTKQAIDNSKISIYDHLNNSHLDSAHLVVDLAIQRSDQLNYNFGKAKSIFIKSYLHRVNNEMGESFVLNLEALRLLRNDQDNRTPKTMADLFINTGEILSKHYRYQEAIQYYDEGIAIASEYNLKVREHELIYNKGIATLKKGSLHEALNLFELALNLSKETQDEWTILNSLNFLGLTATRLKKYELAREYFDKMIYFTFDSESPSEYKGYAFQNIGDTYRKEGNEMLALSFLQQGLEQNINFGDSIRIFEVQCEMSQLYFETKNYTKASELALESLRTYSFAILSPKNYKIFDLLTRISFKNQDYQKAADYHSIYIDENDKFLSSQQQILQMSEQYKMEMLTASFFKDIQKQEQMAQLNHIIYLLLGFGLFSLVFVRAKKYLFKKSLEQAFREVTHRTNFRF